MGDFRKGARSSTLPDSFKRVHYTLGMVMGVDEFEQEQAYFLARGHQHNLSLHGYGTVWGLKMSVADARILVSPGLAISPSGREIRVRPTHEAELNEWLGTGDHLAMVRQAPMQGNRCAVHVVLHPHDLDTDKVVIPATPGISSQEQNVASRTLETFEILFSLAPPHQAEEEAVRRLGALLSRIQVATDRETVTPQQVATMVRALGAPAGRTDGSRQHVNPPEESMLFVHPDRIDTIMQTILRVWVTETRPSYMPDDLEAAGQTENNVLLARLEFHLSSEGQAYDIQVVEVERPFLVETRLLREFVTRSRTTLTGGIFQPVTNLSQLQGRNISPVVPQDGAILTYNSQVGLWEPRAYGSAPEGSGSLPTQVIPATAFVTITKVAMDQYPTFELWFHLRTGAGRDAEEPVLGGPIGLVVYAEGDSTKVGGSGADGSVAIPIRDVTLTGRNRYEIVLGAPANRSPHLRFQFFLDTMRLDNGQSVSEWVQGHPERWVGYDGLATVTTFHHQTGVDLRLEQWAMAAAAENQAAAGWAEPVRGPKANIRRAPHRVRRTLAHRSWLRRTWDWVIGK